MSAWQAPVCSLGRIGTRSVTSVTPASKRQDKRVLGKGQQPFPSRSAKSLSFPSARKNKTAKSPKQAYTLASDHPVWWDILAALGVAYFLYDSYWDVVSP